MTRKLDRMTDEEFFAIVDDKKTNQAIAKECSKRVGIEIERTTIRREKTRRGWEELLKEKQDKQKKITQTEFKNLFIEAMDKTQPLVEIPYHKPFDKKKQIEQAVMLISDCHIGKTNTFMDVETGNNIDTYNSNKFIDEANELLLHTHNIINYHLSPAYNIQDLWLFLLGDIVDNDMIYRGQRFFIDMDVGKQVITGLRVFTDYITALLGLFKNIHVVSVPGNHGRASQRYETTPATRSFDWIFSKMLEISFKEEKRIDFTIPDSFFYRQKIYDWGYYLHHGNSVYSWMSLPYYGIVRQGKSRATEIPYDIECIGHFHQRMEIPMASTKFTLVNGSWIPKDKFSWEKFGVYSYPEQIFFGVSRKRPRTWQFNIDLFNEKQRQDFYRRK